ncbi:MAG: DNA repair protein RadA [Peptococcaceae bacterium]|jgi:DNA repair protein RadA/Sms|nr:DNA repair protein RadA [Peptococcaceae bacterium]
MKTKYVCQACGYESARWLGRCSQCGEWDSMVEAAQADEVKTAPAHRRRQSLSPSERDGPQPLTAIDDLAVKRLDLGLTELNRVLGGGLVPGSLVLLAGDPGIGKSTLLLQAAVLAAGSLEKVWYITGEESARQVKLRADRMGCRSGNLWLWAQTDLEALIGQIQALRPALLIVDSIQTMYAPDLDSSPGSLAQVRECAARLGAAAKALHLPIILVGHVTKDGGIAGPRVLEHMVDTVLYFEGERHYPYRILRAVKNRFGSTFEIGVFEMRDQGLAEVLNPSLAFLADRPLSAPGSAIAACMEGSRPLLAEVQALVCPSSLAQPRRVVTGADYNRVNMILAVLEKRAGLRLGDHDAYINITGGIRLQEPAMDLAIAAAVASSFKNQPLKEKMAVIGEIGLAGEARPVGFPEKRAQEAEKLGLTRLLAPRGTKGKVKNIPLEILEAGTLIELLDLALAPKQS